MIELPVYWSASWIWSLPIILLTIVAHSFGLFLLSERIGMELPSQANALRSRRSFAIIIGMMVLLVTALHTIESAAWAVAYLTLGAMPDAKSAMLYSLKAMTTYGHADKSLEPHWRMMGALEALNGVILFGLTTAFLFAVIQSVSPLKENGRD